jgi:FkbM family methyltransferase
MARLFRRFGYELLPSWRLSQLDFEIHLRALFTHLEIRTVLDVGANRGQYRDFLRYQVGFEGEIISFEPIPELARRLENESKKDPKWRVFPYALGSVDSMSTLNVAKSDALSSFLDSNHQHVTNLRDKNIVVRKIPVRIRQLESLVPELGLASVLNQTYLKLDTQGFDLEVVKGAGHWINELAALQSEVPCLRIYEGAADLHETLRQLCAYGYQITGMFAVNREEHLRMIDFDCVMVNGRRFA